MHSLNELGRRFWSSLESWKQRELCLLTQKTSKSKRNRQRGCERNFTVWQENINC